MELSKDPRFSQVLGENSRPGHLAEVIALNIYLFGKGNSVLYAMVVSQGSESAQRALVNNVKNK